MVASESFFQDLSGIRQSPSPTPLPGAFRIRRRSDRRYLQHRFPLRSPRRHNRGQQAGCTEPSHPAWKLNIDLNNKMRNHVHVRKFEEMTWETRQIVVLIVITLELILSSPHVLSVELLWKNIMRQKRKKPK